MTEAERERGIDNGDSRVQEMSGSDAAAERVPSTPAVELIFLHSSWRISSTWFWSKFRPFPQTACFYEPFNAELTTITQEHARSWDYRAWDSRHPTGDPYYLEYLPLIEATGGVQLFDQAISLDWFTPIGGLRGELRAAEIRYVSLLIDHARQQGKTPVFGETRSLGRIWAIKKSFEGFHVFLHRNLWQQWLSYLYYSRRGTNYYYETTAYYATRSDDPFIAGVADFYVQRARDFRLRSDSQENRTLSDDERTHLLRALPEKHAFAMFTALHIYLYLHGQLSADLTVDITKLARDSGYRSRIESALAQQTSLEISLSDVTDGQQAKGVAVSAAAIDWDEIREHARAAVQKFSAFADPAELMQNATAFIDSAIEEMVKAEAALAMRRDAADEIWYARLQNARCHWALGDGDGFVRQALDLRKERQNRAEPLFDLARFHRERGMHETAAGFAEAGLALERPRDDAKFVEHFVYHAGLQEELSIAAFYSSDPARRGRGFAACNWLALSRDIPEGTRNVARGHLRFYVVPASKLMPSFTARLVGFSPPEGWNATNPSVTRRGDDIAMVQRVVNYVLPENGLIRTPDSAFKTRNFLLRLSPSLEIESSAEILPPADLPTLAYDRVQGFEDLRPFAWRGALWCSSATRELNPEGWHQQVLARIDEGADRQCRLADWRILALEGPRRYEKNWMPFVEPAAAEGGEERLRFIYLCDPTRLVDQTARVVAETTPSIAADQFRGGSQAIAFAAGWLALIHEVIEGATLADRAYHHRFVWFDAAGTLRGVSRPFFLQTHAVEFAAGLTWHPDGQRLIVSYGVNDGESWIATIDAADVRAVLEDATRLPSGSERAVDDGIAALGVDGASVSAIAPPRSDMIDPARGVIIENRINGKKVRFFVTNPSDAIMQYHAKGQFYEAEELELIARHFKGGAIFVDIGANTGNHCVYVSKFLVASKILAFEPNQEAIAILRKNLLLNECKNVDTQFLGIALGSGEGRAQGTTPDPNNLGHTVYSENSSGEVSVVDGDSLILEEPIEFIKIDVEGMEIEVLAGLRQTIRRWRPNLFIEVWDEKLPEFRKWCDKEGYEVTEHFERYSGIQNYVLTPSLPPPAVQGDADANERAPPKQTDAELGTAPAPNLGSAGAEDFVSQHSLQPPRDLRSRLDPYPRVLVAILAKQKEQALPLFLRCIEGLDYPKSSIVLYVRTNNNTDRTEEILREWIARVGPTYAGVELDATSVAEPVEAFGQHEWNATRFRVLGNIRNVSLSKTNEHACDFYFVCDVDNFILPCTLRELVALKLPIVGPLLRVTDPYAYHSNFFADVDPNGFYADCDQYGWIAHRWIRGVCEVPVVHCTYLIRSDVTPQLRYLDGSDRHEFLIFAESARKAGIPQYLDNRQLYGYITFDAESDGAKVTLGERRRDQLATAERELARAAEREPLSAQVGVIGDGVGQLTTLDATDMASPASVPCLSGASNTLPIHVINLDRTPARLTEFYRGNAHLRDVKRFRAIDGQTLDREKLIRDGVLTADCIYTAGNLGCAMSHFALWRKVVEEGRAITIAEDDAIFSRNFADRSREFLERLSDDWDFVQWGWVFQQRVWVHAIPEILNATLIFDQDQLRRHINEFQSHDAAPTPITLRHSFGTVCYSISPKGARALLRYCTPLSGRLIEFPGFGVTIENKGIDCMMNGAYPSLKAFISIPPLVVTEHREDETTTRDGGVDRFDLNASAQQAGGESAVQSAALAPRASLDDTEPSASGLQSKARELQINESRTYSQNGEDGVIESIFAHIGTTDKFFVEIGCADGSECNIDGWSGIRIDNNHSNDELRIYKYTVDHQNACTILHDLDIQREFDLLSIDIDFNDFHVLRAILAEFAPRVIITEFNSSLGPLADLVVPYLPKHRWDYTNFFGASYTAFQNLAKSFGYELVYCESQGVNLFLIRGDVVASSGVSFEARYRPPGYCGGAGHPADSLRRRYLSSEHYLLPGVATASTGFGNISYSQNDQYIGNAFALGWYWDEGIIREIANRLGDAAGVVLDIGAHMGSHSVALASLKPSLRFICFEPQRPLFLLLERNIHENGLCDRVRAENVAVGHAPGTGWVSSQALVHETNAYKAVEYGEGSPTNLGGVQLGSEGQPCEVIRIDDLAVSPVPYIKIDVEGAEPLAFYGMQLLLARDLPLIHFEDRDDRQLGPETLDALGVEAEVREFSPRGHLLSLGYEVQRFGYDYLACPPATPNASLKPA